MPLGWLLLRVLIQLISNITRFGKSLSKPLDTRLDFILASFEATGFTATEKDIKKFSKFEDHVQIDICYLDNVQNTSFHLDLNAKNSYLPFHDLLKDQEKSIIDITTDIKETKKNISLIESRLSSKKINLMLKQKEIELKNKEIEKIKHYNTILSINFYKNRFRLKNIINNYKYIRTIKVNKLFCNDWYTNTYPECKNSSIEPLIYYLHFGYTSTNPNPYFDSLWYINTYKDVKEKHKQIFQEMAAWL